MKEEIKKITRYLFTGGVGAGVNFLIYFILVKFFTVWYLWASIISFTISLFVGFYLQKHFTFRDFSKENIKKQMVNYCVLSLFNLFINLVMLSFFVETLMIDRILAKIFSLAILALWSFFVYQKVIFK